MSVNKTPDHDGQLRMRFRLTPRRPDRLCPTIRWPTNGPSAGFSGRTSSTPTGKRSELKCKLQQVPLPLPYSAHEPHRNRPVRPITMRKSMSNPFCSFIIIFMLGFQARNVDAIRCERIVCVIRAGHLHVKAFQVLFGNDGSLFITFPYFRHRTGLLSASTIPVTGVRQSDVNLEHGGKVTSHLVKYSHHPDGCAHFSQTGKIVTAVKRQSIPLDKQDGHIFSLLIQGLNALEIVDPVRDTRFSPKRTSIEFAMELPEAVKFVGRWLDVNSMRFSNPAPTIGPTVTMHDPDGVRTESIFVASPHAGARHVLAISCVPIAKLSAEPEMFVFYGGFDAREVMTDPLKEAGFLAFLYPVSEAEKLKGRIGSVDYIPRQ
jgi:hypothetical protein